MLESNNNKLKCSDVRTRSQRSGRIERIGRGEQVAKDHTAKTVLRARMARLLFGDRRSAEP